MRPKMEKQTNAFQISICKILFPYTVELARNGNYKEAEASLRFMLGNDISSEYLLLLGKVYAQQGKYQDAIGEWKKVLDIDSENHEAKAAILKAGELTKSILPSQLNKLKLISWLLCFFFMLSVFMNYSLWKKKGKISIQYE